MNTKKYARVDTALGHYVSLEELVSRLAYCAWLARKNRASMTVIERDESYLVIRIGGKNIALSAS